MRTELSLSIGSIFSGIALFWASAPFWWFGLGLIAAGAILAASALRPTWLEWTDRLSDPVEYWGFEVRPSTVIAELVCVGALFGIAAYMLPEALAGVRPINRDHPVHFYKAWQLVDQLFHDGQLRGWSHQWFAGYPSRYLYPLGGDLFVALVYSASFGLLTVSQAYAVAIFLFWFLGGYAVYRFATLGCDRWIGLLAGLLFMTDTAQARTGGWFFSVHVGVWPMTFSSILAVWASSKLPAIVNRREWRHLGAFGILMGASVMTHPFAFLFFAIAVPAAWVAYLVSEADSEWPVVFGRVGLASVIGLLVAALWFLPFLVFSDQMSSRFGGQWTSAFQLGEELVHLTFLKGTWRYVSAFGLLGVAGLLASRKFSHILCATLALVFLAVGATDFPAAFHLLEAFEGFRAVHFKRFVILLKPYWVVAAAYGLVAVVRAAARGVASSDSVERDSDESASERRAASRRSALKWAAAVGLAAPFLIGFGHEFWKTRLDRNLKEAPQLSHKNDRRKFVDWLQKRHPNPEETPFFRIALDVNYHDHSFLTLGTELPWPLYKVGHIPATSFQYRFYKANPRLFEALNIRYVLSDGPTKRKNVKKLAQFGQLHVYKFKGWDPDPFEVVEGDGSVQVQSFEEENIVLEADSGSEGRLRLNVSAFPNWTATRDGKPVDISVTSAGHPRTGFMTVPLRPGTYRFTFERGWPERLSWLLFLFGMLGAVGCVAADHPYTRKWSLARPLEWGFEALEDRYHRRKRLYDGLLAGLMVVGLSVAGWIAARTYPMEVDHGEKMSTATSSIQYDFAQALRRAEVSLQGRGTNKRCPELLGRFICGDHWWQQVHTRMADFGYDYWDKRCIWAHPPGNNRTLKLRFEDVPTGRTLTGFFGVTQSGRRGRGPVQFRALADGRKVLDRKTKEDARIHTFQVPTDVETGGSNSDTMEVVFEIQAQRFQKRHFCFNAQVVE